ncbi:hypothetical protein A4A49_52324 [Nicotiana attenuata]|uniref:Uncharacterized protein n=1 Tax=Nicotiana attenuata TaxID=49451 RepID=A0A1J6IIL7_NICAT|nr:hypothetical protein A4A49_52324 [Nicotiana attenuata]
MSFYYSCKFIFAAADAEPVSEFSNSQKLSKKLSCKVPAISNERKKKDTSSESEDDEVNSNEESSLGMQLFPFNWELPATPINDSSTICSANDGKKYKSQRENWSVLLCRRIQL